MRFAKRLDAVPPYCSRSSSGRSPRSAARAWAEQPGDRRSRPADGRKSWSRPWQRPPRPAHAPVPDQPRLGRAARGRRGLLSRALRRRARPGLGDRARPRRQGGGRSHRAGAARPRRHLLSPDTGYPPYTSGPLFAGAEVHYLPLRAEHGFLPRARRDPGRGARARESALPRLPEQPDRRRRCARLLRARGRARARTPGRRPRQRVFGALLRRLPRAELPRDAGREGGRRRDLLALEGLEHDRAGAPASSPATPRWSSATGS